LVVRFLLTFSRKPMLFFGGLGLVLVGVSAATFGVLALLYLMNLGQRRPIFDFAGVLLLVGVLFFFVGFLAELIVSQNERVDELEARLREFEMDEHGPR
jgi:membrane associated rhomboid family serine protease